MKKVFQIFRKDLKNIIKNPAAIGIIIGLCIIPSFYAWITLKANWNPYVDTGNVPVAVVNNDAGTIVNNKIVNFGNNTVKQLESNDAVKWTFVGQKVADQGLKDGSYYAVVEIPSDFSTDLESGITGNPIKPNLIYKVNEKTNAIATKITDLATAQLQQEIKQTFLYTVSNVTLKQANALGKKINNNKPMILEVKDVISNTNNNIGNILKSVNSSSINVGELGSYIGTLKNNLPKITNQITNLEGVVSSSKYLVEATQSNIKNVENSLNTTNNSMNTTNNSLQNYISNLKNTVSTQEQVNQAAINSANSANIIANNTVASSTAKATNTINQTKDNVNKVATNANETAQKSIDNAKQINTTVSKNLDTTKKIVNTNSKEVDKANEASTTINKDVANAQNGINKTSKDKTPVSTVPPISDTHKVPSTKVATNTGEKIPVNKISTDKIATNTTPVVNNTQNIPTKKVEVNNVEKTPVANDVKTAENNIEKAPVVSIPKIPYLSKDQINKDKKALNSAIVANKSLSGLIDSAQQLLGALNKLNGKNNGVLNSIVSDLNNLQSSVQNQSAELNNLNQTLSSTSKVTATMINSKLDSISELSTDINSLFGSFTNSYASNVSGSLTTLSSNLNNSLDSINSVLLASKQMIPELNAIANMGITSSSLTVNKTNELKSKLDGLKTNLNSLESKTSSLTNTSLDNLVNLLNKNPEQLSKLLSSPVGVQVKELYGMSIFGIGLAPFYTVLAIWVGALLCTTIIGVNAKEEENGTKKRIMEIHFGKMLLFIAINFVQATIVTLGDIFILGIHPANFWLLMGFAWFSGIVFTVIIFTLVSLNGNFGKAGALVIMVVQVAGSGAIYPIEVNPIFFQKTEFLWPFTYAVDAFRQAIGGPDWSQVGGDVIALLVFLALFLLMGFAKMFLSKQIDYVENAFRESQL
ncbi:YhgE/Pip domain-containing protein [uncultured Clostridium sp.]|jgi:putative membrane protein|uniref:YhgE/Pip domain-containing protein n=1 Tax=uncultured Clostridium sp. TaxID=59620 RepID=UPI0026126862|nr:YhgE/Pip domain-containing protein [uncultured Clostridium sp.]